MKYVKKIVIAMVCIGLAVALYLYRDTVLENIRQLEVLSKANVVTAAFLMIGAKLVLTPLGFPGIPLTLLSGSIFGNVLGTIVALVGNTLGAIAAFLLSRYVLRDYVQEHVIKKYPALQTLNARIEKKAFSTVIALRLIPLFPFNALNYFFGVTNISLKTYAVGSFVGMIPGSFLFVYFGESLRMLSVVNVLLAIIGIALLTYIGKLYEKKWQ